MPDDPNRPYQRLSNGHLWAAVGRYIVSFLCGVVVASFVFGGKTQQFSDLLLWRAKVEVKLEDQDKRISDNSYSIKSEIKDVVAYDTRLRKTEEQMGKIDTLVFKVEELTKSVENLKNQKR